MGIGPIDPNPQAVPPSPSAGPSTSPTAGTSTGSSSIAPSQGLPEVFRLTGSDGRPLLFDVPVDLLSIGAAFKLINEVLREFRDVTNESRVSDYLSNREVREAIAQEFLIFSVLRSEAKDQFDKEISVFSRYNENVDAYNASLDEFNNTPYDETFSVPSSPPDINVSGANLIETDNFVINRLNQAQADYNANPNATTQAALDDAISLYDQYFASNGRFFPARRYNRAVERYNENFDDLVAEIEVINAQRAELRARGVVIPDLPVPGDESRALEFPDLPDASTAPIDLRDPILPIDNIISNAETVGEEAFLETALAAVVAFLLLKFLVEKLDLDTAFLDTQIFFFGLDESNLSDAYIDEIPEAAPSSEEGEGAGASALTTDLGLQSPNLERILAMPIFEKALEELSVPITPEDFKTIILFAASQLAESGSLAGLSGIGLLSENVSAIDGANPGGQLAIGLAFLNNILSVSSSEGLEAGINLILEGSIPDPELRGQVAAAIADAIRLALLQIGIQNVTLLLETPGLIPLLLQNTPGVSRADVTAASSPNSRISDVLRNPFSRSAIVDTLAGKLAAEGDVDANGAKQIVAQALASLATEPGFKDDEFFAAALTAALVREGVTVPVATSLADEAVALVRTDTNVALLDTTFNAATVKREEVLDTLQGVGISEEDLASVVDTALAGEPASVREFRDLLLQGLIGQGVSREEAIEASKKAVAVVVEPLIPTDPLLSVLTDETVSLDEVKELVRERVRELVGEEASEATIEKIANGLVEAIDTFRKQYAEALASLKELGMSEEDFKELMSDFIYIPPDTYAILKQVHEGSFQQLDSFVPEQGFGQVKKSVDIPA